MVELCETHADTHGVFQKLFSTALDACLLLLVKGFAPKCIDTVSEAPLHQRVVHPQAVIFIE